MGQEDYENYVSHYILKQPSVSNAPVRRLLTMAPAMKRKSKKITPEEKEREVNKCLRRRLAWCNQTGKSYDAAIEQYSLLPRAIADLNGLPHKGNKSNWTNKLESRYTVPEYNPLNESLKWNPDIVVIDAMFLINTTPLRQHKTIAQYAHLLLRQFLIPYYIKGSNEIHLIFDHPKPSQFNSFTDGVKIN